MWRTWLLRQARSLRFRLALLISIAILPLGIVAVLQTSAIVQDARALEERALLARTARAVNGERALLRRAYGAADALGAMKLSVAAESEDCSRMMQEFVRSEAPFVFAGFIDRDGIMRCSSQESGGPIDFSGRDDWEAFLQDPAPTIVVNREGPVSGRSVLVATVPVRDATGRLAGAASVSMPHDLTDLLLATGLEEELEVALLDRNGKVLSASSGIEDAARFDAAQADPGAMRIGPLGSAYEYERADGTRKIAVVVPLIDDRVYVLGLWRADLATNTLPMLSTSAPVLPVLMWAAALAVALMAVDRLVLKHLLTMQRRMNSFSVENPAGSYVMLKDAPEEIDRIAFTYNRLLDHILADRAELSETLKEKEVLLREVHHRVKNNLQLIASILNMQIRNVQDPSARLVLRRVQDRVMSLSSIHKLLYSGKTVAWVRADRLLNEVLQTALSVGLPGRSGVETQISLDQAALDPDQAVPLALLVNELATNALKYIGRPSDGPPVFRVSLEVDGLHMTFRMENSVGTPLVAADQGENGTGLGVGLVDAFTAQLDGDLTVEEGDNAYVVTMTFTAMPVDLTEIPPEDLPDTVAAQ